MNDVKSRREIVYPPSNHRLAVGAKQGLRFLDACLQTLHESHQSSPFNTQAFITPTMSYELLHCLSCHINSLSKKSVRLAFPTKDLLPDNELTDSLGYQKESREVDAISTTIDKRKT
jgi:hypothetical protein